MAANSIRVEYNQDLQSLEDVLSDVRRAGEFFVHGTAEIPMPRVEVAGVGVLSFPVPAGQIAELVQRATRAPYGRGEETLLDESVRKVWQLPPDKVRVGGKSWAASFENILQQVVAGLGCEGMAVSAELYKLLVYDAGGFFLAHRDTEKAGGMFGTLVVVLPSAHRGGELVIRHAGRETTVDLSSTEFSEVSFVAFYADCEHEVRPITEGNRVCLVYNLIRRPGGQDGGDSVEAPDYERQIAAAARLLETHLAGTGAPAKIAWLLEHQYSPDGLSFAGLKSTDAARVKVLAQAAELAGCAAQLGIVHIEESGAANPIYRDYGRRGYGRRGWRRDWDDGEGDVEDAGSDDFEVIEVSDWHHFISEWRDLRDQPVPFGELPLEPGELLPVDALDGEKPDTQRLMEASGNEGASFERSYHRAALVIWRRERYAAVLLQSGIDAVLPHLKEKIEAATRKGAPPAARQEASALARQLVRAWQAAPDHAGFRRPGRPEKRDGMLRLLTGLGDAGLLKEFVSEVVTPDYDGSDNDGLVAGAPLLGAKEAGRLHAELVRRHMPLLHGHCVDLLRALASASDAAADQDWRDALRQIADAAVNKLDDVGKAPRPNAWMNWRIAENARPVNAALVANLLNVIGELEAPALRAAAAEKFTARPAVFDPVTVLVPALKSLRSWDAAALRVWEHSVDFLLQRSGGPPAAPTDWRQDVKLSCSCDDCRELLAFTLDPVVQMHRFRVREDRRQHLQQMIGEHELDMSHFTELKGSPRTMVCTKNRRSYQRRCEEYGKDISALGRLADVADKAGAAAVSLKRIQTARDLAAAWTPV